VEADEGSKGGGYGCGQRREEGKSQIIRNGVLELNLSTNSLEIG
jgi:hypothetical protein